MGDALTEAEVDLDVADDDVVDGEGGDAVERLSEQHQQHRRVPEPAPR